MKKNLLFILLFSFFLLGHLSSYGQKLPFQGRLMENGVAVTGTRTIVFSIQDLSWTETHTNVSIQNGLYYIIIGSITPLPNNMFDKAIERTLDISVNGTALSPVKLYPALAKSGNRYEKVLEPTVVKDTARYTKVSGGGNTDFNYATYTEASTNAGNVATYGRVVSQAGSTLSQYALYGNVSGEGTGSHIGVLGNAAGSLAKNNTGIYGWAHGPGDGSTGLENGSYNNGVVGYATKNNWGNSGVFGHAYGSQGVDNIGVVGWSSVSTGSNTTENKGVLGWAKGTGINKGIVGMATGGAENWAGWFNGNVHVAGKYLNARVDSISLNDVNGRQAIVLESMLGGNPTSFIGGYGTNGKGNFFLYSNGPERNYGNLGLKDATGATKAWISANYNNGTNAAGGLVSLYGPTAGWIGAGFKQWEGTGTMNLPYVSLEGTVPNDTKVWINVEKDASGNEFGAITLSSANGKTLRLDPNVPIGVPTQGPTTENFLMTGKDWEGKGDYPLFELRGTINSQADGNGYTLPLASLSTNDNGAKEWGSLSINSGTIGGNTIQNQIELSTANNASGLNGMAIFRGPSSDNIMIGAAGWETGGADRGWISLKGNTTRPDGNGGSYTPDLIQMQVADNSTTQYGRLRLENQSGGVSLQMSADNNGNFRLADGSGFIEMFGNGNMNASGTITANTVTQTSDMRYKEKIETLQTSLANVARLRGVSYYWKDKSKSPRKQIGLIAQEVEVVYPEFVHTDQEGFKSVNYASMVAVLIEAVKELQAKVDKLEQDKQQLMTENASLKTELEVEMQSMKQRMLQLEKLLGQELLKASTQQATSALSGE